MDTFSSQLPVSHQNVRLGRGKHLSPRHGACVVEIASMLAGETFTDRPASVCPMVGAYMRALNDLAGDEDRQLLWPYAAAIVDSAGGNRALRARLLACLDWLREAEGASRLRLALMRWSASIDVIGERCARAALGAGMPTALGFADRLLEVGSSDRVEVAEAGRELATILDHHLGRV